MRTAFLLGVGVALLAAAAARAADPAKADKADPAKLVGTWTVVAGEKEGMKEPEERIKGTVVRFTADNKVVVADKNDKQTYSATYKVDTSKTPWGITMTATDGPDKGKTADGIVLLEGDDLKLCYAVPGEEAPKEFATKAGKKQLLFVMKRAKP
jgi:uncharacterized protein (TIGR03067 family)